MVLGSTKTVMEVHPQGGSLCSITEIVWGRRGFTRQPENSKRAHLRVPAFTPPIPRNNLQEKERMKIVAADGTKARNFGHHTLRGPTFSRFGAPPFGAPTLWGPHSPGPNPVFGRPAFGDRGTPPPPGPPLFLGCCLCCFAPDSAACFSCCCFWPPSNPSPTFTVFDLPNC